MTPSRPVPCQQPSKWSLQSAIEIFAWLSFWRVRGSRTDFRGNICYTCCFTPRNLRAQVYNPPRAQIYEKLMLPMNAYELSYAESGKARTVCVLGWVNGPEFKVAKPVLVALVAGCEKAAGARSESSLFFLKDAPPTP